MKSPIIIHAALFLASGAMLPAQAAIQPAKQDQTPSIDIFFGNRPKEFKVARFGPKSIPSPLYAFKFKNVKQVFLRDCIFEANSRRRSGREPTASCSSPAPRRSTSARSRDRSPRSEVRACLVKAATGFVSSAPRPASAAMGRTSSSVVRVRSSLPRGAGTA